MKTSTLKLSSALLLFVFLLIISGCATAIDVEQCIVQEPEGFVGGFIHGLILPISFFFSLFDEETVIYAMNNNGGWYDFGFVLGASMTLGGSSKATCRKNK